MWFWKLRIFSFLIIKMELPFYGEHILMIQVQVTRYDKEFPCLQLKLGNPGISGRSWWFWGTKQNIWNGGLQQAEQGPCLHLWNLRTCRKGEVRATGNGSCTLSSSCWSTDLQTVYPRGPGVIPGVLRRASLRKLWLERKGVETRNIADCAGGRRELRGKERRTPGEGGDFSAASRRNSQLDLNPKRPVSGFWPSEL